jgi:uncharacterized Zn-finger protein
MNRIQGYLFVAVGLSLTAGCVPDGLDGRDERDLAEPDAVEEGVAVQMIGSAGNPFTYIRARDQQLTCFGISVAPNHPSNCDEISDSDDRQMCRGMSARSQAPCFSIADRNLQLACFGMSVAPSFPSNCTDITDEDMRNFCFGVSSSGAMPNCDLVVDLSTRALCLAMANRNPNVCIFIDNANDQLFCRGATSTIQSFCFSIL